MYNNLIEKNTILKYIKLLQELGGERPVFEYEITNTYPVSHPQMWNGVTEKEEDLFKVEIDQINTFNSIYFHIPFCTTKCSFCFYTTITVKENCEDLIFSYLKLLGREIDISIGKKNIKTNKIYIGGGTPSFLSPSHLDRFLKMLKDKITIQKEGIFTTEVSPETINEQKLDILINYGVNRISIGIESLNDYELKILRRPYTVEDAIKALKILNKKGIYFNVDIIIGIPGQNIKSVFNTLKNLLLYSPSEITIYYLRVNPHNTILKEKPQNFWIKEIKFFKFMINYLKENNYIQTRPHHFIRNTPENIEIWKKYKFAPYTDQNEDALFYGKELGFGISAVTHIGEYIFWNTKDQRKYQKMLQQKRKPVEKFFRLRRRDWAIRFLLQNVQKMVIDLELFNNYFGKHYKLIEILGKLEEFHLLKKEANHKYVLTSLGVLFYDSIERIFINLFLKNDGEN